MVDGIARAVEHLILVQRDRLEAGAQSPVLGFGQLRQDSVPDGHVSRG
jgi:hypothetical protein